MLTITRVCWKTALTDLPDTGLSQTFNLEKMQYLQSTIKGGRPRRPGTPATIPSNTWRPGIRGGAGQAWEEKQRQEPGDPRLEDVAVGSPGVRAEGGRAAPVTPRREAWSDPESWPCQALGLSQPPPGLA